MCLGVRSHLIRWPQGSFISTMRVNIPTGFTNRLPDSGESQQFHACPWTSRQTFQLETISKCWPSKFEYRGTEVPCLLRFTRAKAMVQNKLPACHITHFHCLSIFPICSSCFLFGNTDCF